MPWQSEPPVREGTNICSGSHLYLRCSQRIVLGPAHIVEPSICRLNLLLPQLVRCLHAGALKT